jgi:hypothetical protein
MDELKDWKQNPLLRERYMYVSARDVVRILAKQYPNATKKSVSERSKLLSTFVYIVKNHLGEGEKSMYTVKDIAQSIGVKTSRQVYDYNNRHTMYCEKYNRYREKFLLVMNDIRKVNERQKKYVHGKIDF